MFEGRKLLIATQHEKEKVIAPLMETEFGLVCEVNSLFDTDSLGTFTAEVDRKEDVITTLKKKCLTAMQLHNVNLAIASEGSFGAHPTLFFAAGNEEFLILIDLKNDLEIIASELTTNTNFNAQFVSDENELLEFAERVQFPSHGLIIRSDPATFDLMYKGITDESVLLEKFDSVKKTFGRVYVETDMRACYNPTRMQTIEKTTQKLIAKIKSKCPNCSQPGFDVSNFTRGLPCGQCSLPTRSILSVTYSCKKCNYESRTMHPNNKSVEDPTYCDYCNP